LASLRLPRLACEAEDSPSQEETAASCAHPEIPPENRKNDVQMTVFLAMVEALARIAAPRPTD
jgi:hypothetical protein